MINIWLNSFTGGMDCRGFIVLLIPLSAYPQTRPRHYIYHTMHYVEGQTLKQWMLDQQQTDCIGSSTSNYCTKL